MKRANNIATNIMLTDLHHHTSCYMITKLANDNAAHENQTNKYSLHIYTSANGIEHKGAKEKKEKLFIAIKPLSSLWNK